MSEKIGLCKCGHSGDAPFTDHEDGTLVNGHGACKLCECKKFTWVGWIDNEEELV